MAYLAWACALCASAYAFLACLKQGIDYAANRHMVRHLATGTNRENVRQSVAVHCSEHIPATIHPFPVVAAMLQRCLEQELAMSMTVATKPSSNAMMDELKRLREENARLKAAAAMPRNFWLKITEKKGLSVGIGAKYPVTLYAPQWVWLLKHADQILACIEENKNSLSWEKNKD